jgi:hypothetical protein
MMHRVPALLLAFGAAFPLLVSAHSNVSAQQTSLSDVLARAAEYVTAFADPSRVILCEERYEHTFLRLMVNAAGTMERLPQGGHDWVAEMAIMATPDDEKSGYPWLEFRDIVTLDGKPARNGLSRLGMLATMPLAIAGPEARKVTRETSSTQFGRLDRAVLLPRLTCVFLHAANQPRFVFKKGGERTIRGVRTWEVKFQEKTTPTIVASTTGKDAPSAGSFWIDPATGHILASFLKNGDSSTLYNELTVTYALDRTTGLWLPATLADKTTDAEESRELEGTGTFRNWRVVPRTAK